MDASAEEYEVALLFTMWREISKLRAEKDPAS